MKKSWLFYFLILFLLSLNTPTWAYNDNYNEAINLAAKQRMLTQRMLKNYILIGIGNRIMMPKNTLIQDISRFDYVLNYLKGLQISPEIQDNLNNLTQQWLPIKNSLLQKNVTLEILSKLYKEMDVLLQSCHQITKLIIKTSGTHISEIINLSGRQRMLSQRMGALYILQISGLEQAEVKLKLKVAMNEFAQALKKLYQSKLNSVEIKKHLNQVTKGFDWFKQVVHSKQTIYLPSVIAKKTDYILYEMDKVTQLYIKNIHLNHINIKG